MQKFSFDDQGKTIINHNLTPVMKIEVIRLKTPYDYQSEGLTLDDVFDERIIKGWHHVFLVVESDIDFDDVEDFTSIRAILKRCAKWYLSKILSGEIELDYYKAPDAVFETKTFKIQESQKPGWWIATHKDVNLCIEFRQGKFNETQRIVPMEDFKADDFMNAARYIRELGDWLAVNHRDKM